MTTLTAHKSDCMCLGCMMTDMDDAIRANGLNPDDYPAYRVTDTQRRRGNGNGGSRSVRMITEGQIRYIQSLLSSRQGDAEISTMIEKAGGVERLTFAQAGKAIDTLKLQPWKPRPVQSEPAATVEDGFYVMDDEVYKVQIAVHGSGRPYAKKLVDGDFVMARGMVRKLRPEHRMTREQAFEVAKVHGDLYGRCFVCGRMLTDEESIDRGMGPVCVDKF